MTMRAIDVFEDDWARSEPDESSGRLDLHNDDRDEGGELGLPTTWARPPLTRLRFQLPLIIAVTALLPGLLLQLPDFWAVDTWTSASNSFLLTCGCGIVALVLFRRLEQFPGIASFAQVAPSVAGAYGIVVVALVILRIDYSRPFLLVSALNCLLVLGALWIYYRRRSRPIVYLLPDTHWVENARLRLHRLTAPTAELQPNSIVAADLRSALAPRWQRFILTAALAGIPVYDARALEESATGKVQISHLSENTFGSVLPSHPYLRIKRVMDVLLSLVVLPAVGLLICAVTLAIKLDSSGPVFFRQPRVGFRGRPFVMLKFRTMRPADPSDDGCAIDAAMTKDADPRITRVGKFLRRHRIDELPQIFNILRGEMSWIGPRPEAEPLARFYEKQIPFYGYRHMVRPGLTGWAQVSQGHVVHVDAIRDKLNYDFFYIKNFSAWLDALIAARTVKILLFGSGAK
jgi:lipopolysaccharide/colanic/teichoic acid biosynthesis glycosyltransferase